MTLEQVPGARGTAEVCAERSGGRRPLAAARLLERLDPEDYARKDSMTLKTSEGLGLPVRIIHEVPEPARPARGTARVVVLEGGRPQGRKPQGLTKYDDRETRWPASAPLGLREAARNR
jgi:hypothetical protein